MMHIFLRRLLALFALALPALPLRAGEIIEGDTGDGMVSKSTVNSQAYNTTSLLLVGTLSNDLGTQVEAFPLPYLAPGQTVTGATISFYLESLNYVPTFNVQLYGMSRVSTNPAPLVSDFYYGSNDTANTLLDAKFVTPNATLAQTYSYTGGNLTSFVQKQYANSAFSGQDLSSSRYIFFRLSPDAGETTIQNYVFGSAREINRTAHPMLSLTISNGISSVSGRLQFAFNLPQASVTSAGVYNPSTGALIRTLWNNVQFGAGNNYGAWDGKDDSGAAVASGTNYQIKLIYHNVQYVWQGAIGNTSASQTGPAVYRAFFPMSDMTVAGGKAFYAVGYNEQEGLYHYFNVGTPQVPVPMRDNQGDPFSCMPYVAADATRSYWTKAAGGLNSLDTCIVALNTADQSFYTFPKGVACQSFASTIDRDTTANQPNPSTGIAVQQTGSYLFVSHGNLNIVRVFDKVQGNLIGTFSVTNPGLLRTTANGDVWVISNASTPVINRYTFADGKATLQASVTTAVAPVALCPSADDSILLVADAGTSQQVKAFNNNTGALEWTYGTLGGRAVVGPNLVTSAFDFTNHIFVAFQADNTVWISDAMNFRYLHYSISGNSLNYLEQISYIPVSYTAEVDLTDATRVFSGDKEYKVNYALPIGGLNNSWSIVRNWAYGLPSDSTHNYTTESFYSISTLSNGKTFGLLANDATGKSDLMELSATGPARVTGYAFNNIPRIYEDGTLRFNIQTATTLSFYSQPLTGFDAVGNPKWGTPSLLGTTAIGPNDPQTWSAYAERTEVTASGVVVDFDPYQGRSGFHLGGIAKGGTAWQWRSSPSTTTSYKGWFPQDGRFDIGNGVQYAGDVVMAMGRNLVYGYHGEFWRQSQASQWINFYDNGLMVGKFGTTGLTVPGDQTSAGFSGNAYSPTLVTGPDGNVYMYHNDESNHAGVVRWLIKGWNAITEVKATGQIGGTASLSGASSGPTVSLTSPTPSATYLNGNTIFLSADVGGSAAITGVQFFDGSTSLGTVSTAPYNLNYAGMSSGSHLITAVATDANGNSNTSASIAIVVGSDGTSAPPPAPIALAATTVTDKTVALSWSEPAVSPTSSTVGQILSFQFDNPGDSDALAPTAVAGVAPYSVPNFNLLTKSATNGPTMQNMPTSTGLIITNLGINIQDVLSNNGGTTVNLPGTVEKVFTGEVSTAYNQSTAISISNVPFALYDLVVYSATKGTAWVTVSDNENTSSLAQTFTVKPTGYAVATVAFGSNASYTDINTIVIKGMTSSTFKLQGGNLASFQIVERPYDRGLPTSFAVQRAPGTSGTFTSIGTAGPTATSFSDNSVTSATGYQYRMVAVNGYGNSANSNTLTVTTLASSSGSGSGTGSSGGGSGGSSGGGSSGGGSGGSSGGGSGGSSGGGSSGGGGTTPTSPTSIYNFAVWQAKYFTTAQLADATVSGPQADPFGTGVPNLMAYALQLNPATATPRDLPHPKVNSGHLTLTYFSPTIITDITYTVEVSSDLTTWNSGSGYTQVSANVASASGNTITVQDVTGTGAIQRHFMRLRVSQN